MIIVAGTVRIEPSKLGSARGEMEKMIKASRAEDGCIDYSYAVDVLDPSVVHVFEAWRDRDALTRHFNMPHLNAWRAAWTTIGVSDRNLQMYEISAASPL
jgi:quinol monooxygenase YgiN